MIYASDLDRTLIYSERFLTEEHPTTFETILVDEARLNSYMDKDVLTKLISIVNNPNIRFIPITTRSFNGYSRINIPGITPEYAVTSNGGLVLHNGKVIPEWEEYINKNVDKQELECMLQDVNKLPGINYESKLIDDSFIFSKSNEPEITAQAIKGLLDKYTGYKFFSHRDKIYIMPDAVSKDKALLWLKRYLGENYIVSSGDSQFDMPMLSVADLAVIPEYNSIDDKSKQKLKSFILVDGGVRSPLKTFEIIENILYRGE